MSSTVLAIVGVVWLIGGILGAVAYRRMADAEKPELKWPFPFFDQLYNKRIHVLATVFFLLAGLALIVFAVVQ